MGKLIGIGMLLGGIGGFLWEWITLQNETEVRWMEMLLFLQRLIFAMESQKVSVIPYLENYRSKDRMIEECLSEIAERLKENVYPCGREAWEDVLLQKEKSLNLEKEGFRLFLCAGEGIFGRKLEDNILFLKKILLQLEDEQKSAKERMQKRRKVWIPLGMFGGIMLTIIFL